MTSPGHITAQQQSQNNNNHGCDNSESSLNVSHAYYEPGLILSANRGHFIYSLW